MENNKVIKFKDYLTTEQTYKVNADGKIEKQEWELYKDWHPAKFKISNLTKKADTTPFDNGEFVWVIKQNEVIVATFSSHLDKDKVELFFNNLKGTEEVEKSEDIDDESGNTIL